jgi:hypothetical protein
VIGIDDLRPASSTVVMADMFLRYGAADVMASARLTVGRNDCKKEKPDRRLGVVGVSRSGGSRLGGAPGSRPIDNVTIILDNNVTLYGWISGGWGCGRTSDGLYATVTG